MPAVRGEGDMHGGKGGDEMVFRRANGSLGGVGAVLVGRNMLKSNVLGDEEAESCAKVSLSKIKWVKGNDLEEKKRQTLRLCERQRHKPEQS